MPGSRNQRTRPGEVHHVTFSLTAAIGSAMTRKHGRGKKIAAKLKRARVPGYCSLCNTRYRAGTILAPDGQGRWVHKTCGTSGTTHYIGALKVTEPYGRCTCGGWLYEGRDHTCKGGV